MDRIKRRARPSLEGLEGRQLLSVAKGLPVHAEVAAKLSAQFQYTSDTGAKVTIQVIGGGNLNGTTVGPDGGLNLVFAGTSTFSTIQGTVKGGSGFAQLDTIRNANVTLGSLTGIGGELVGRVLLPKFNLVSGGDINLLAGVQVFTINSAAANSQIHLRDTPLNTTLGIQDYVNVVTGAGESYANISVGSTGATSSSASGLSSGTSIGASSGSSSAGSNISGIGTLDPEATGFGGGAVGAINGAIPIINTVGNGQNVLGTPGLTQSEVSQGRSLTYTADSAGGEQLTAVGGAFTPGINLLEPRDISKAGEAPPPPGVVVTINHVSGGSATLGDPQIYGYDPTTNALIRFDATTGVALQSITLPTAGATAGGVALARDGAEQVVLVGVGANVLAYDAATEGFVGQFSVASLAGEGLTAVTGIATGNMVTVLSDSNAGTTGVVQAINVASSLATGEAVAAGASYSPAREFILAGGLTGVAGTGNLYGLGAAHFDTFQPNVNQAGILTIGSVEGALSEFARTVLTNQSLGAAAEQTTFSSTTTLDTPANANGTITGDTSPALGSLESNLALDVGVANGQNVIQLLSPSALAKEGTFTLDDANPLSDLSESFHPEIAGTALIDVQGNIQSFTSKSVSNLLLDDSGNLNLLTVNQASNSTVIGEPFSHVSIPVRSNVVIETNTRLVGTRGGVIVNPSLKQIGPFNLP